MGLLDVLNGMQNGPRGQLSLGTASGGGAARATSIQGHQELCFEG